MAFYNDKKRYKLIFLVLLIITILSIVIGSTLGTANISFKEALCIMIGKVPLINKIKFGLSITPSHEAIVLNLRLPRIILSALIGMGLSMVGASFQTLFKNPMADPYILGVSSGASLGAAIAIICGFDYSFLGMGMITFFAFVGSIITTIIVYEIAKVGGRASTITLLLSGVAVSFFISSLVSLLMIFNRKQIDKIVFWTMGSTSTADWKQVIILFASVVFGFVIIYGFSKDLNIMLMGDDTAKSLGVEVEIVKKILIVVCSVVVAACVSVSGVIGFVGLIVPHAVRLVTGSDHKLLIPLCTLSGALFMILSDTLSRTLISPSEIPIGVITSLVGAPYFIILLIKFKKKVM